MQTAIQKLESDSPPQLDTVRGTSRVRSGGAAYASLFILEYNIGHPYEREAYAFKKATPPPDNTTPMRIT